MSQEAFEAGLTAARARRDAALDGACLSTAFVCACLSENKLPNDPAFAAWSAAWSAYDADLRQLHAARHLQG